MKGTFNKDRMVVTENVIYKQTVLLETR